ncbi:hypothetical protein [Nonomuraea basaltis]|uniref:hypothetical protein n=1 Tax=Nonomuraea basaltis TaxID=2495887 RepID=UPI001485F340|nr:hypothetical protein [Nonomuraea basaltis]
MVSLVADERPINVGGEGRVLLHMPVDCRAFYSNGCGGKADSTKPGYSINAS